MIPFTTTISNGKRDKHLEQKLLTEKSGILNWLIEGALRWQEGGLNTPSIVLKATDEYRGEMDVIGNFIQERCIQQAELSIRARELFRVYQQWCEESNELATSERYTPPRPVRVEVPLRMFGLRMRELGIMQKRSSDGRYWQGIGVLG